MPAPPTSMPAPLTHPTTIRSRDEMSPEYLATLKQEAERLTLLVENVLGYARLEQGRAATRRRSTSLEELLNQVVPPLERLARDSGMTLELRRPPAESGELLVDTDRGGAVVVWHLTNTFWFAALTGGAHASHRVAD